MGVVEKPSLTPKHGTRRARWIPVGAFMLVSLVGCSTLGGFLQSEFSRYAEPADGPRAYLRLMGSRNVKLYPNSNCVSVTVPGSGYPAGPQMGGQRKRDVGMPKAAEMPKHYVEVAARAEERITAAFSFYSESYTPGIPGTGAPGTRRSAGCFAAGSFVPVAGENYEVTSDWRRDGCSVKVARLVATPAGNLRRVPVPSEVAQRCPASGESTSP